MQIGCCTRVHTTFALRCPACKVFLLFNGAFSLVSACEALKRRMPVASLWTSPFGKNHHGMCELLNAVMQVIGSALKTAAVYGRL